LTQGDHIALEQMDPIWREKRKVISHNFSPKNLDEKHFQVQEAEYVRMRVPVVYPMFLTIEATGRVYSSTIF
jgi:hypothetical protein